MRLKAFLGWNVPDFGSRKHDKYHRINSGVAGNIGHGPGDYVVPDRELYAGCRNGCRDLPCSGEVWRQGSCKIDDPGYGQVTRATFDYGAVIQLGALYGFIDSKMSLLALESDTLSKTIALQYQDQGVPELTAQEIIIKPSKKPAAPKENAIFESVTGVLKQVICKLDFQAIIANGMLHIQFTNKFNGVFKLLIVDASGRVVQKYTSSYLSGTKVSFLIPRGLKGLYLMQIEAGKEHLQKKLLLN